MSSEYSIRRFKILSLILSILIIFNIDSRAQTKPNESGVVHSFSRAKINKNLSGSNAVVRFSTPEDSYTLTDQGILTCTSNSGTTKQLHLKINADSQVVSQLLYCDIGKSLLLIYEVDNYNIDSSQNIIINIDKTTFKIKWENTLLGINTSGAVADDGCAYIAGSGFIGKLNTRNGKWVWQQTRLYKRSNEFNVFEVPEFSKNSVKFNASSGNAKDPKVWVILNRKTGKILEVSH